MDLMEQLPDKLEALRQVLYFALPSDDEKKGHWHFWLGFWERSFRNPAVRRATHVRYAEWLARLTRLLRNAQESGDIAANIDLDAASRSCAALVDGIAVQVLGSGHPLTPGQQQALIDEWIRSWLHPSRPGRI
jgi:hypothetical protein